MASDPIASPPIIEHARTEQASAWIAKWQSRAPHLVLATLSGNSMTVHAVPSGMRMFALDWDNEEVTVNEAGSSEDDYRFREVQSALIFLDAVLVSYLVRLETAITTIIEAPRQISAAHS